MADSAPVLSTARPTPLRLWGFLTTALGALLMGVGSILAWGTIGLTDVKGVDTPEGKVVLVVAILVLAGIPAMRVASSGRVRRAIALGTLIASVAAGAIAVWALADRTARIGGVAIDEEAHRIAQETGLSEDRLKAELERLTIVEVRPGIYVAIAGAVLGAVGGGLSFAWARREHPGPAADAPSTDEPTAIEP